MKIRWLLEWKLGKYKSKKKAKISKQKSFEFPNKVRKRYEEDKEESMITKIVVFGVGPN